ncbi:MAG: glutaminyl-peptide cyclotransferase [Aliidongia sp.]
MTISSGHHRGEGATKRDAAQGFDGGWARAALAAGIVFGDGPGDPDLYLRNRPRLFRTTRRPSPKACSTRTAFSTRAPGWTGNPRCARSSSIPAKSCSRAIWSGADFGEGIVDWGKQLIGLTWKSHNGFVADLDSFAPQRHFTIRAKAGR